MVEQIEERFADVRTTLAADGRRASLEVRFPEITHKIWFESNKGPMGKEGNAALAVALIPAMRRGIALRIDQPLSARLRAAIPNIQDIVTAWWPMLRRIRVEAPPSFHGARGEGVAAFFSGGVDSFYTALKHLDEITALVFVTGFDIPNEARGWLEAVQPAIRAAAAELGKPLIEVRTNVREFSEQYAEWGKHYHGAALAAVALLLSPHFRRIYIPSTHGYAGLVPWGSHPLLDPLWSTENTELVHDGCEALRVDKVMFVAQYDVALRYLRTCWRVTGAEYNCGKCSRCVQTMLYLHVAGVLDRSHTFPHQVSLPKVMFMPLGAWPSQRASLRKGLRLLGTTRRDRALRAAIRFCLAVGRVNRAIRDLADAGRSRTRRVLIKARRRIMLRTRVRRIVRARETAS